MKNIAVIGLGLLGASLGLALQKSKVRRLGWARSSETRQWCLQHNVIDQSADDITDILKEADFSDH